METIILSMIAIIMFLYIIQPPKDNRTIDRFGKHKEYDNEGYISTVRTNMMNDVTYRGYCGNSWAEQSRKGCDMPRTQWVAELKQFRCPKCGWVSQYPDDFIKRYINQHNLEKDRVTTKWKDVPKIMINSQLAFSSTILLGIAKDNGFTINNDCIKDTTLNIEIPLEIETIEDYRKHHPLSRFDDYVTGLVVRKRAIISALNRSERFRELKYAYGWAKDATPSE